MLDRSRGTASWPAGWLTLSTYVVAWSCCSGDIADLTKGRSVLYGASPQRRRSDAVSPVRDAKSARADCSCRRDGRPGWIRPARDHCPGGTGQYCDDATGVTASAGSTTVWVELTPAEPDGVLSVVEWRLWVRPSRTRTARRPCAVLRSSSPQTCAGVPSRGSRCPSAGPRKSGKCR